MVNMRRPRLSAPSRQPSNDLRRLTSQPQPRILQAPPRPIEAAIIATTSQADLRLDRECVLERARVVSTAPNHMPYIAIRAKYNKRWYVDIIALPHNAIRFLLARAFDLVTALHRLVLDLTVSDFDQLFAFLHELDRFVRVIFEAEEKVLYPEVDAALKKLHDYQRHPLHPTTRARVKNTMLTLLSTISPTRLRDMPSVQVAAALQTCFDSLTTQLLDYFAVKEADLPRIIAKSLRGIKEKTRLEDRLIKYFEHLGQEFHYTALLISTLVLPEVRAEFEERHFAKGKRGAFQIAVKELDDHLMAIPTVFTEAAAKYEARFGMNAFLENYGQDRDAEVATQLVA